MSIEISLQNFDGPLDLLLHLIRSNEMDIYDIQMVEITEQYLSVIEQMKQLNLDVAGEFLLMAATLIHIKSKMLLPVEEEIEGEEEELDPRAELVRRLLEYQRYKDAANSLEELPCLDRDVFLRNFVEPSIETEPEEGGVAIGIYQLASAFHALLKQAKVEYVHEVTREQLSVADCIPRLLERLGSSAKCAFSDFFVKGSSRQEMVVTFLAMLELVKMRMIKISQSAEFQPIWLSLAVPDAEVEGKEWSEDSFGYG